MRSHWVLGVWARCPTRHVAFGVRSVVADVSYVEAREGRLTSRRQLSSFTAWCRALLSLSASRLRNACVVSFQVKAGYIDWSMSMIPTNKVLKDNTRVKQEAPIHEEWSGRHRGTCLVGEWLLAAAPLISDLCVRGGRPPGFQDDTSRFRGTHRGSS